MAIRLKGAHVPQEVMLMGVRWYGAYPLSPRHVAELMAERGVDVDHSPINRWTLTSSPRRDAALHRRKRPVWVSWRRDETDIKGQGQGRSRSRAVENTGQTSDVLLTEDRDAQAAKRLLTKALRRHGVPAKRPSDGRAAHAAAIKSEKAEHGTAIAIRHINYRHTMVEQDPRGVKRLPRPMGGCTAFDAAQATLIGIEVMPMIKQRQRVVGEGNEGRTAAEPCDALAASSPPQTGATAPS
jgi:putative transposase